jgi:hypothetical protein
MLGKWIGTSLLCFLAAATGRGAATDTMFVGMGDSIGEGVQSGDASVETQKHSYQNLIASHMGAVFPLTLIASGPFGVVGETANRSRIDPTARGLNLAVSGADVHSLLYDRADGVINSETDLVLMPRTGSQMEIAAGGGYTTQFILLSAGPSAAMTISFFGDTGSALAIGK